MTPTTPTILKFPAETRDALADRLEAEGFQIGRPAHVSPECIACDRETAAETTCDQCGHVGLEFLPFRPRSRTDRDYRAMAWCCCCDAAFEL